MRQYLELLKDIRDNGEQHDDRTGVGTLSVFGRQIRFDLLKSFPLMTTKKIPLRWVFEELKWFLSGSTYEPDLRDNGVDIWKEWATAEQCARFGRTEGNLGPVYGSLWRHFGAEPYDKGDNTPQRWGKGVDQIDELLADIIVNPNSRRLIVTGWNPETQRGVTLPPCHTLFQFKVHPNKELSCHLYARSIDAFLGLPFNIASYALLTKMIGTVTGLQARELIISFGDVHIYKNHLEAVEIQLGREPSELPTLGLPATGVADNPLEALLAIEWKDVWLNGYCPLDSIPAPVAI